MPKLDIIKTFTCTHFCKLQILHFYVQIFSFESFVQAMVPKYTCWTREKFPLFGSFYTTLLKLAEDDGNDVETMS